MAGQKYEQLAENIMDLLGGKENVSFVTHCATRLRMTIIDINKVDSKGVCNQPGVVGDNWSGNQYQIIIGNAVPDAYKLICDKHGLNQQMNSAGSEETKQKNKLSVSMILDFITGCVTPLVPVMMAGGFLKLLVTLTSMAGILTAEMPTYIVLSAAGDAAFYFLPVFVGANTAKKLGGNISMGMMLGAILIHPDLLAAFAGESALSIFRIPIYTASYASSVVSPILCVAAMIEIQKFIGKHSPDSIRSIVEPFFTMIIAVPLSLCLLGPLGAFLSNYAIGGIVLLYEHLGFVGVAIFAAFQPLLVFTGMHQALVPYLTQAFSTLGYECFAIPGMIVANINQGMAGLAVALKTKDANRKTVAFSGAVTALFGGVTEPILYGVNLKYKTPMIGIIAGGLAGGAVVGLAGTAGHVLNGGGLFTLAVFLGEHTKNLFMSFVGVGIGMVVTFLVTLIVYKDSSDDEKPQAQTSEKSLAEPTKVSEEGNKEVKEEIISACCDGKVVEMADIPDPIFSGGMLGKCCAVEPTNGNVYAPIDGTISVLTDTSHAIGITSENGLELLLHIGIDTVSMKGEGFLAKVKAGQKVKKGELLVEIDLDKIRKAGYPTMIMHIIANTGNYHEVETIKTGDVHAGDDLLRAETIF